MKAFTNRYELKYILDWQTYFLIRKELDFLFKRDPVAGKSGKYDVISVYYDTPTLDFFWEKIDGEDPRVKVRLRTYKHHDPEKKKQDVFLEIKEKKDKTIFKKRVPVDEKDVGEFLKYPFWSEKFINKQDVLTREATEELLFLKSTRQLKPTVVISYTREPFVSTDNLNVRITFDSDVRYRSSDYSLTTQPMDKHVLSPRHVIMEIKYTNYFPQWIVQLIQKYQCEARTFSKYCIGMEHFLGEQQMLLEAGIV